MTYLYCDMHRHWQQCAA